MLSSAGSLWPDPACQSDPLLSSAGRIVKKRLENKFSWKHEDREEFWLQLCQLFPSDMMPKGTVNAALDSALDYLARVTPIKIVTRTECFNCKEDMGWFEYEFEGALEVNTTNLETVPDSLSDLILVMISRQMKKLLGPGGKRVQCKKCGSFGEFVPDIRLSNLSLPPVLFLGFLVKKNCSQSNG